MISRRGFAGIEICARCEICGIVVDQCYLVSSQGYNRYQLSGLSALAQADFGQGRGSHVPVVRAHLGLLWDSQICSSNIECSDNIPAILREFEELLRSLVESHSVSA